MAKIQTVNQLISVFKDIAKRHYQINGFGIGDNWEVGASEAKMHPVLWINPISASMPESENVGYKTFEIDFEVRVFDLVNKDESNENDVLSDTIDILKDIITEFKGHPYYVNSKLSIVNDIDFDPFTEEFDEEVSGWVAELSMKTPVLTSWCGLPMADITGFEFPGNDCPDVNVLCPVFIEDIVGVDPIQVTDSGTTRIISIDTSSLTGDTYTTGVTFTGNVLTSTLNDGTVINTEIDNFSGLTVNGSLSATTYYGDGSQLTGISTDNIYIADGTITDTLRTVELDGNTLQFEGPGNMYVGNAGTELDNFWVTSIQGSQYYGVGGIDGAFQITNPGTFESKVLTNSGNNIARQTMNGPTIQEEYTAFGDGVYINRDPGQNTVLLSNSQFNTFHNHFTNSHELRVNDITTGTFSAINTTATNINLAVSNTINNAEFNIDGTNVQSTTTGFDFLIGPNTGWSEFTDNSTAKDGILLRGFGEADRFDTTNTANWDTLQRTSLITKGYVDDEIVDAITGLTIDNIYTANGALTSNRAITLGSRTLTIGARTSNNASLLFTGTNNGSQLNVWSFNYPFHQYKTNDADWWVGTTKQSILADDGDFMIHHRSATENAFIAKKTGEVILHSGGGQSTKGCEEISLQGDTLIDGELVVKAPTTPVIDGCHIDDSYSFYVDSGELKGRYKNNLGFVTDLIIGGATGGIISIEGTDGVPVYYSDLQTAFDAMSANDTINLHTNIELTATVNLPELSKYTINMNGHRIWGDTTTVAFNLLVSPNTGIDRDIDFIGGGIIETIGSRTGNGATPIQLYHQFATVNVNYGTTQFKSVNGSAAFILGGRHTGGSFYSENGGMFAAATFTKSKIDLYDRPNTGTMRNCRLHSRYAGFLLNNCTDSHITGVVTRGGNYGLVYVSASAFFKNNTVIAEAGSTKSALYCRGSATDQKNITDNVVSNYGTGKAGDFVYGSSINNTFYAESNQGLSMAGTTSDCIGNTCITNSTNTNALNTLAIINSGNNCIVKNASNTAAVMFCGRNQLNSECFGNNLVGSNASAPHIQLRQDSYVMDNKMNLTGTGLDLNGNTNLMTNTTDAYGNIKIG